MKKEEWDEEKKEQVLTDEDETVNKANALWARAKNDISDEEYTEFYKHVSHDFEPPLAWTHARSKAVTNTRSYSMCPKRAPFDLWDRNPRHGLKLYVRRVFIMDDAEKLMPHVPALRAWRGGFGNDLPLNVSREILQESKDVDTIRAGCTKKVLNLLEDLAENQKDKYADLLEGVRPGAQGGPRRRSRQQGQDCWPAALRLHAHRHGGGRRLAGRLHRPHEGRAGQDLLRHRRELQRRQEQPAPGDLPQEGHRGAAAV
jgi:HSP90 family molecular chaperone